MKKRVAWIDILKGILILCVIWGHSSAFGVKVVYLFHMPLFFLISGYTERYEEKSLLNIFVSKFAALVVPYFLINLVFIGVRCILQIFGVQGYFYDDLITAANAADYVERLVSMKWITDLGGATWFLFCLFVSFVLAKIIVIITKNRITNVTLLLAAIIGGYGYLCAKAGVNAKVYMDLAFIATFLNVLGAWIRAKNIVDRIQFGHKWIAPLAFVGYVFVWGNILNGRIDYANRDFNNVFLDLSSVIIAFLLLLNISLLLEETVAKDVLVYLGRNSLSLMALHFLIFRFLYWVLYVTGFVGEDMLKKLCPNATAIGGIVYTVVTVVIFIFINELLKGTGPYQTIFLGKLRLPVIKIEEKFQNGWMERIIVGICIVCVLVCGPKLSLVHIKSIFIPPKLEVSSVYEDGFLGKECVIAVNDKAKNLCAQFYVPDNMENSCEVFVDGTLEMVVELDIGLNVVQVPLPENECEVKVVFSKSYIPAESQNSNDERELSVMLVGGEFKLEY